MATRVYLPSTGAPSITPAFGSDWQHTSNADRIQGVTTRISSSMTGKAGQATADLNDQLGRQYVVGPLGAQTLAGTISGVTRATSTNLGIGEQALSLSKCSSDGSGVTLIVAVNATTPDDGYPGATATARQFWVDGSTTDTTIDIPSTAISAGDYLLVEIGWRKSTANIGRFPTWIFGDNSATDLGANETDTAANNPWVEFSQDLTFAGGGIAASLTATLGNITATAAARIATAARLAGVLGATTLQAAGRIATGARLQQTLGNLTLAGAFTTTNGEISATLAGTLGNTTLQAAGRVAINGRVIGNLGDLTLLSAGQIAVRGRVEQTLGALTLSAHATQGGRTAALTATLGNTTLQAAGRIATGARLEQTLGALTAAGSATIEIRASLAATLGNLTLEAATQPGGREAQLTATLGDLTLSAAVDTGYEAPAVDTPTAGGGVLPVRYRNRLKPQTQPTTPIEIAIRATEEEDQCFGRIEILPMVVRARMLEPGDHAAGRLEVLAAIETRATEEGDWVRGHVEADWKHDDADVARADRLLFGEAA